MYKLSRIVWIKQRLNCFYFNLKVYNSPSTSCAVERAFSGASAIFSDKRKNTKDSTAEHQLQMRNNPETLKTLKDFAVLYNVNLND